MGHEEFFSWLLKVGMGWLGWSYDQTINAPMAAITLAYEGRADMISTVLKAVFGEPERSSEVSMSDAASVRALLQRIKASREATS